jgi:2-polyprenyl-3-methyl-5-hydroxy-6-metoxy-1,4-benzoquinol methylase
MCSCVWATTWRRLTPAARACWMASAVIVTVNRPWAACSVAVPDPHAAVAHSSAVTAASNLSRAMYGPLQGGCTVRRQRPQRITSHPLSKLPSQAASNHRPELGIRVPSRKVVGCVDSNDDSNGNSQHLSRAAEGRHHARHSSWSWPRQYPMLAARAVEDSRVSDWVMDEQIWYYRQRAAGYDATAYGSPAVTRERITRITSTLPTGVATLELACGTGMWTEALARGTGDLTAIDAAPEALDIARRRCPGAVQFACADIFRWVPERRYQLIFFAFWLSHVPSSRLAGFFSLLDRALAASGEVVFIDEHVSQASKEQGRADPEVVQRSLPDGTVHRLVKVFVDPPELQARLDALGWSCELVADGTDWVIGRAQPVRGLRSRPRARARRRGRD